MFNGTHHVIVGITSFSFGICAELGSVDGFARVTHQIDWIIENSDDYVKSCSGQSALEKECPSMCTEQYDPVCGSDGITYSNACKLEVEQCEEKPDLIVTSQGECSDSSLDEDCPLICMEVYDPVCGSDGATYSNACKLEVEKCHEKPDLTIASQGECY